MSLPIWIRLLPIAFAVFFFTGCAETDEPLAEVGEDELAIPSYEDYFGGKDDTGYVGNRAAEIEATFAGRVRAVVPDKTEEELMAIAEELLENGRNWQHREITAQVTEQIKYARNALKAESLNLNLEGGNPIFSSIDVFEGGLELNYTVHIESLVKFKDLEDKNLTIEDLVGRAIDVRLPLTPTGLFDRVGAACTTDPDTGEQVDPEELGAHNLFYYFDPDREECPLTETDLQTATYSVESSLDAPTVYPEYDLLIEDGRIDMVVIFGQIKHGELGDNDWGFISFNDMSRSFRRIGFEVVETYPENRGHRLEKTYPADLTVTIDMYTPVGFADDVPREEANERFRTAIRNNEIVYYNGHAFYGSLRVLDDPSVYPQDAYQIILMDACWSYAYYTKQIFRNRATDDDPDGYALVDVVNNTEPGITGSEATATVLWQNIFKGSAAVRAGSDASLYSWNNIVTYMNEHAEARALRRHTHKNPEIYGVSGVVTNAWHPAEVDPNTDVDPDPNRSRFANEDRVAIPDNDSSGITSVIRVPEDSGRIENVRVRVEVEHTYVGDLTVSVIHGGSTLTLHERTGGNTSGLNIDLDTQTFAGTNADGDWILRVIDSANIDTGDLVSWSIEF